MITKWLIADQNKWFKPNIRKEVYIDNKTPR